MAVEQCHVVQGEQVVAERAVLAVEAGEEEEAVLADQYAKLGVSQQVTFQIQATQYFI